MSDHFNQLAKSIGLTVKQFQILIDTQFAEHSIFSPSGSAMWYYCSGSLLPNMLKTDDSGEEAAQGTVAHELGDGWLKSGVRPSHRIGDIQVVGKFGIEITESMLDYVQEYVDRCACLPGKHFVETRINHSGLTPIMNQMGRADHAACEPEKLVISDLKFGKGIRVDAKDNTQGLIYAYGFFMEWDWVYNFQTIVIRIIQPRLDHYDEWSISRAELFDWAERITERAFEAWQPNAPRHPGAKQCQWCRVKPDCAAHAVFSIKLTEGVFDNMDITDDETGGLSDQLSDPEFQIAPVVMGSLTTAEKARLLPFRKMSEAWWEALGTDLEERGIAGEEIPGFKLVVGRSDRQFIDERKVVSHLEFVGLDETDLYNRKLVGIGAVEEKLMGLGYKRKMLPRLLESIVIKPNGKPVLVSETDKRDAITNVFENLDGEEL